MPCERKVLASVHTYYERTNKCKPLNIDISMATVFCCKKVCVDSVVIRRWRSEDQRSLNCQSLGGKLAGPISLTYIQHLGLVVGLFKLFYSLSSYNVGTYRAVTVLHCFLAAVNFYWLSHWSFYHQTNNKPILVIQLGLIKTTKINEVELNTAMYCNTL